VFPLLALFYPVLGGVLSFLRELTKFLLIRSIFPSLVLPSIIEQVIQNIKKVDSIEIFDSD